MAWVFVRLKLAILRNGFRGHPGSVAVRVLGAAAGLGFAAVGFALFAIVGSAAEPHVASVVTVYGGALIVLGWTVLPAVAFGVDETLDPARLAPFPLPRRSVVAGMLAAAATGVAPLATLAAFAGTPVAMLSRGDPAAAAVAVLAVFLATATCLVASRAVTSVLASTLRTRRGRELPLLVAGVVALVAYLFLLFPQTFEGWGSLSGAARVADVVAWTPFGAPFAAPYAAAAGRTAAAAGSLAVSAVTLTLLLAWWGRSVERAMRTTQSASSRTPAGKSPGRLFPRGLGWLPATPFGALVAREIRYCWREPRKRWALLSQPVLAVAFPAALRVPPEWFPVVAPAALALFGAYLLMNVLGYDRQAWALHILVPVPGRMDIAARLTAQALLLAPLAVLSAVVPAAIAGRWGLVLPALGLAAAIYGVGAALVAVISVYVPFAFPDTANPFAMHSGGGMLNGLLYFGWSLGVAVGVLPVAGIGLAAYFLVPVSLPVVLPLGLGYGFLALRLGTAHAGQVLDRSAPETLAAISPSR